MNVFMAPPDPGNPYVDRLASAVESVGHRVEVVRFKEIYQRLLTGNLPDVVHIHWLHPYFLRPPVNVEGDPLRLAAFLATLAILKARGVSIVWTLHNLVNHGGHAARLDGMATRCMTRLADLVLAHSAPARLELRAAVPPSRRTRVEIVPHASYLGVYPDELSRSEARAALGIAEETNIVAFVGRIAAYKGVQDLMHASRGMPWEVVAAGEVTDPALLDELRREARLAGARLDEGNVPDEKLQVYLHAADVVALPFRRILTSGSAILALSFGVPVVLPDHEVLRQSLPQDACIFYPPEDVDGLRTAIERALADREKLREMSEAARRYAESTRWTHVGAQVAGYYESLRASTSNLTPHVGQSR